MPPLAAEAPAGQPLAVLAEGLFLANLLLAPGLAFLALCWLWAKHRDSASTLARQHLRQAVVVSLWGGILIVCCTGFLFWAGHWQSAWTWVVVILYFTCIHSLLVVLGILGLSRAMAGQAYRYPLIGPRS